MPPVRRMSHIKRFSGDPMIFEETLAAHKGWMSVYTWALAEWLIANGFAVDYGVLFRMVALHDVEEVVSGDVHMRVKRAYPEEYSELMEALAPKFRALATSLGSPEYADYFEPEDSTEAEIVVVADLLCVAAKFIDEAFVGNVEILEHFHPLEDDIRRILDGGCGVMEWVAPRLCDGITETLRQLPFDHTWQHTRFGERTGVCHAD